MPSKPKNGHCLSVIFLLPHATNPQYAIIKQTVLAVISETPPTCCSNLSFMRRNQSKETCLKTKGVSVLVTVDEKSGYIKAHYEINKDYCKI